MIEYIKCINEDKGQLFKVTKRDYNYMEINNRLKYVFRNVDGVTVSGSDVNYKDLFGITVTGCLLTKYHRFDKIVNDHPVLLFHPIGTDVEDIYQIMGSTYINAEYNDECLYLAAKSGLSHACNLYSKNLMKIIDDIKVNFL